MSNYDFLNPLGTKKAPAVPKWLEGMFGMTKKASTEKVAEQEDELSKEDIEEMILANDRLSRLEREADKDEEVVLAGRLDPSVTPYSSSAKEKIASHWAGDTPEDIKKAEGDVVNDGDKVRDEEEKKFDSEAKETEARIAKENKPRNYLWEVADGQKKEAAEVAKKVVVAKKEEKKEDKKDDKKKDAKKEDKKKEEKKVDKKDDKKADKKDDKKKEEKKAAVGDDEITKLALRAYRRNEILRKFAEKSEGEYGKEKSSVQFQKNWYDEIVGDKTNIGNVREAEIETGVEKEAAVNVGLDFTSDPSATGEYGVGGDFKVNQIVDENASVLKDVEKEPMMGGDEDGYAKELGTTHKAGTKKTKKAHYNNRTQGMQDDGPTAPAQQDTGRDSFLRQWWVDQVKKTEADIKKEYSMLGDGKKEMHTDAIDFFRGGRALKASLTERALKREAMVAKVAADGNEKSYYSDAYGDAGYAADLTKDYKPGEVTHKKASTLEERKNYRRKLAGLEPEMTKTASVDKEAGLPALLPMIGAAVSKLGPALAALAKNPAVQAAAQAAVQNLLKANPNAGQPEIDDVVQQVVQQQTATAASSLEMRKEARKKIVAQAYGEPVKEPNSDKVGDPDWDASELTRNSIVDSPQEMIMKQLEQAISKVREASSK